MSLKALYSEEENSETATATQEEVGVASTPNEQEIEEPEVEMNWNMCNYLPESGSCQDIFRVMVAGHIHSLYSHEVEGRRNHAPGSTPIQRRHANITQSQVSWWLRVCQVVTLSYSPPPLSHPPSHTLSLSLSLSLSLPSVHTW